MSQRPSAAYPLIARDLASYCHKLMHFPDSEYWIHESVITRYLGLPKNNEYGPSESLTALIYCIKNGYGGTARNKISTGCDARDLADENNGGRVYYQIFGEKEEFERGTLSVSKRAQHPRWFHFGKGDGRLELKLQIEVCNHLIGKSMPSIICSNDVTIPAFAMKRRQKQFRDFYKKKKHMCNQYLNHDIPAIIYTFACDAWPHIKVPNKSDRLCRRFFEPSQLDTMEDEFRTIMAVCNALGTGTKLDVVMDRLVPSSSTRENRTGIVAIADATPQNMRIGSQPRSVTNLTTIVTPSSRRSSISSRSSSNSSVIPDSLRKDTINCVMDGVIMWDMVEDLASMELLLHLHVEEDFAWDALEREMQARKVNMPTSFEPSELQSMSTKNKRNAVTNIKLVRDDLMESLGGFFVPEADELLHEWLGDGKGYSNGRRVEADITSMNSNNLRHTTSPRVQWILRHIFYHFNLPVHTIPPLWASFYTLIMDRVISTGKFIAQSSIWNNTMYLKEFDDVLQTQSFKTAINTKTSHGFQRYFYTSSDDSKHWKQNRHVLIASTFDFDGSSDLDPSFRHITSAVSNVKSSNAEMNAKEIVDLLGIEAAVWYGGGCNDNANDAQAEIRSTFDSIMNKVEWNIDHRINELTHINGVKRRPTNFGDPFHWANLTVMHASKAFAGDTENGAHEQVHH